MKYRKIFTFILLLCTIFGTLLFINPTSKAAPTTVPPTDLTGYTVTVPVNWNAASGYGRFSVSGTYISSISSFTYEFTVLNIGYNYNDSPANNEIFYGRYDYSILNSQGISIVFTGGTDTTNQNLISWFVDNNATFDNGEEPEPDPTYTLNGGFKFNTNFATSNFYSTDIDIDFTNYFAFPYSSNYPSFVNFTSITFQERDNTRAGVMYYVSEYGLTIAWSDDLINGLGFWNNYNNPTLITQFIKFNNVVVSEDIYNWLNSVGTFGDFDYTDIPDDSTGDTPNTSRFQWLINDIDAFMNLEPLPDLSFYDILLVFVSIPLLIYILKLFLGG